MSFVDDLLTMAKGAKLFPTWRDKLSPASFRGVPFFCDTSERSGGRRTVKHEYPGRDVPYVEDLGMKAREFKVDGYVLGADYFALRDKLLTALEASGPAELVHPYHGKKRCMVTGFSVRETRLEGGIAQFSMEFSETPAQPVQPSSVPNAAGVLAASALAALSAVRAEFLAAYDATSKLTGSVSAALTSATSTIKSARKSIVSPIQRTQQESAILLRRVTALENAVSSLVRAPEDLVDGMSTILGSLGDRKALAKVYTFEPGTRPPATTASRVKERANFDATQRVTQRLAVIYAATAAVDETFNSYDEALTARNDLCDLLDEQADLVSDDTYPALLQLRADLVKAIPGDDRELARLVQHTPHATLPSLVIAYRLYGDLDSEADLVTRNHTRHPGFVAGGRALEVLSRV